jgi:peptide chain release factor 2
MQLLRSRLYEMELEERMKASNEIEANKMKIEGKPDQKLRDASL